MTREKLLKEIDQRYQVFLSLLNHIHMEDLAVPGVNGVWSVKDTLAHINAHEERMLAWMAAKLRGATPVTYQPYAMPDAQLDALNAEIFTQNRSRPWEDVLSGWQQVHAQTITFVKSAGQELFDSQKCHLLEGEPL